jgi:hypothetical protein
MNPATIIKPHRVHNGRERPVRQPACPTCGESPCRTPHFCRACRDADARKARSEKPHYVDASLWRKPLHDLPALLGASARRSSVEVGHLRCTATVGRFSDGRIGEIFLTNHKSNSAANTNARDAAIVFSIAVQHGADVETIRKAVCRDSHGRASGPLGVALDRLAGS